MTNSSSELALSGDVHTDGDGKIHKVFSCDGFIQVAHKRRHNKHSDEDLGPEITLKQRREAKHREINPLWMVDHLCAMIRADIGCLARRTWVTTKTIEGLQDALDLYIAYHNRLPLFDARPGVRALGPRPPHPNRVRIISPAKRRAFWLEQQAAIRDDKGNIEFEDWDDYEMVN